MAAPAEEPLGQDDDGFVEEAFAQCHMPVAIYDQGLRIVRASDGMVRETGLPVREMAGLLGAAVLLGAGAGPVDRGILRVFATGEAEQLETLRDGDGDRNGDLRGARREWSVALSPLTGPDGRVDRVQLIAMDVTELRRARERLALLSEVGMRVGTTLDVAATAQEMADLMVGTLADFVAVDLLDPLFRGVEPKPSAEGVELRRAAQQSVLPGVPESVTELGAVDHYPDDSPPARSLATGESSLHNLPDPAIRAWEAVDPARSATLQAHRMHSIMIVPVRARGVILGVALLVRHRNLEPFGQDDLLLAEDIAARAAVAVDNARLYTRERATALALQQSLLPQRLAGHEPVDFVSRYLPAGSRAGVGGDWFDVIPLSGARVALVVGDVVGHGLRASATMGRLRTAVRTLADVDLPPDELLAHLDDLVTHLSATEETTADPELGAASGIVATCLYLVYDPIARTCAVASAGHPAPMVVGPDGAVEAIDVSPGPPLGVGGLPFEARERDLAEGSLLVLYTDGLVRADGRDVDKGIARLRETLGRPAADLEAVCDNVLGALLPAAPEDDVALLVAQTRGLAPGDVATWEVPDDPAAVAGMRAEASRRLAEWGRPEADFALELVVSELVTNALRYGAPPIRLRLIRGPSIICEVCDGSNSSPHLRRARTFDEGGRGLLLVAQVARRWGTRHQAVGKAIWAEIG